MKVLIGCEFSGVVRDSFIAKGHDAVSCDLEPSETAGPHIQGDLLDAIHSNTWDMLIAFPPCTHLCVSGARWWPFKRDEQEDAVLFVAEIMTAPVPKIAVENPVGLLSKRIRKPDQIIQPWQFGHPEVKTTCLWLKGLPPLVPTSIIRDVREQRCWKMPPGDNRSKDRSRTYPGIAAAMADQWNETAFAPQLDLWSQIENRI